MNKKDKDNTLVSVFTNLILRTLKMKTLIHF